MSNVDPLYSKKVRLNAKYGLTYEGYLQLFRNQNYRCAICMDYIESNEKSSHVDHDHATGKVRGILCTRCNTGLGMFRDSTLFMENAIAYLRAAQRE